MAIGFGAPGAQCSRCCFRSPEGERCCWAEFALGDVATPPFIECPRVEQANPKNDCQAFVDGAAYRGEYLRLVKNVAAASA